MPGTPSAVYNIPTMAGGDAINQIDEYTVALAARIDTVVSAVPQQAWQTINLTQFQSNGPLSYYKDSLGMVHLRGDLVAANVGGAPGAGTTLCTLPAGYRPGVTTRLLLIGEDGSIPRLGLTTAGVLTNIPALGSGISYSFGLNHFRAEN